MEDFRLKMGRQNCLKAVDVNGSMKVQVLKECVKEFRVKLGRQNCLKAEMLVQARSHNERPNTR